mmetsp:Transcript_18299/g.20852  ORF Transcript_18299/g.20852 Transcript_18299/m.20852 type:complete len:83 (+) Transcript_18299:250-498(+)
MTQKAISSGEKIKCSNLDRNSAWTALKTMTMKSLQYPLPALTLSSIECKKSCGMHYKGSYQNAVSIDVSQEASFMDHLADKV